MTTDFLLQAWRKNTDKIVGRYFLGEYYQAREVKNDN